MTKHGKNGEKVYVDGSKGAERPSILNFDITADINENSDIDGEKANDITATGTPNRPVATH